MVFQVWYSDNSPKTITSAGDYAEYVTQTEFMEGVHGEKVKVHQIAKAGT